MGSPTHRGGAEGAEMPVRPEPHLSEQPGRRRISGRPVRKRSAA